MSTELARIEDDGLGQELMRHEPDFLRMLGSPEEAARFVQEAYAAVNANPFLRQCTAGTLFGALYFAAQLGLPVGGPMQQFHLTPRQVWNPKLPNPHGGKPGGKEWQVVPVVGYNGLITLAMNTGEYDAIEGKLVYANDEFEAPYDDETGTHFKLRPASGDRGELIGVIGRALVKGANRALIEYLGVEEIRERMRPDNWEKTPWGKDEPAMVKKTGIRRVSKYTAKSRASHRFALALAGDEGVVTLNPAMDATTPEALVIDQSQPPAEDWAGLVAAATDKAQLQELWSRLVASQRPETVDEVRPYFAARYGKLAEDSRPESERPSPAEMAAARLGREEMTEEEYERVAAQEFAAAQARGEA